MTDDELLKLLRTIRELAMRPWPEGSRNDPQLVWALGRIAGIASAVITDKKVEGSCSR